MGDDMRTVGLTFIVTLIGYRALFDIDSLH